MQKGRGAQINSHNRFTERAYVKTEAEGIDDFEVPSLKTEFFYEHPKAIVNRVDSQDLNMAYSLNPYQGCEHGCVYCYARNSHNYWGFSAGSDFESKIIIKKNAPELLEQYFNRKSYIQPVPIALSGNTDCYQPMEKKLRITRRLLELFLQYRHPVGIITKNALILRDMDILKELAQHNLVHVYFSVTTLDKKLQQLLEPRTSTPHRRMQAVMELSAQGVPVGIMNAPIIPALNLHEMESIAAEGAEAGALSFNYTVVRLNGDIGKVFEDWLELHFPDRKQKVLHQIASMHGGQVNDSQWGRRMRGDGNFALLVKRMFQVAKRKYFADKEMPPYNTSLFIKNGQFRLF